MPSKWYLHICKKRHNTICTIWRKILHRSLAHIKKILKCHPIKCFFFLKEDIKVPFKLYLPTQKKKLKELSVVCWYFFVLAGKYNSSVTFSIFLQKDTFDLDGTFSIFFTYARILWDHHYFDKLKQYQIGFQEKILKGPSIWVFQT